MTLNDPAASEIVCVIDALDECTKQDRERLMHKITHYFSDRGATELAGGRLKVLITSRPYGDIDWHYGVRDSATVVRLDGNDKNSLIMAEIIIVIDVKVPVLLPKVSKIVQQTIIRHLQVIENRTYLWLHLMLDYVRTSIAGYGSEKRIIKLIQRLPPDVNKAYQSMLSKCADPEQGRSLLCLVVAAKRPLFVSEIQVALRLTLQSYNSFDDSTEGKETDEQFKDSLKNLCGLILSVRDGRVYLIHQTSREFLTQKNFILGNGEGLWQGSISPMLTESLISRACISFLCLRNFQAEPPWGSSTFMIPWLIPSGIEKRVGPWIDKYIFLRYAAEYWAEHFKRRQDSLDANLLKDAADICRVKSGCFWTWYPVLCARLKKEIAAEQTDMIFPSWSGLITIVKLFTSKGVSFDAPGGGFGNALQAAAHGGHESVIQLLVEKGANVNAQGGFFGNALQAASRHNRKSVVKFLLEKGANVNARGGYFGNALQAASYGGYESVVQLLLEKGADTNARGGHFGNALWAASREGHESVVQLLLEKGANVTVKDDYYDNVLHVASRHGHESVVQLLLENGANVNARGGFLGNALQAASKHGHESVVQLLLENGANVNAQGGHFGNALQAASYGG
jgi:ankyrin repeat protein